MSVAELKPKSEFIAIEDVTDIYMPDDGGDGWHKGRVYKVGSDSAHSIETVDARCRDVLQQIILNCRDYEWPADDPNAVFIVENMPFRVHFDRDEAVTEHMRGLFIVRRGATTVPVLDELTLPPWWAEILTSPHLNSGGLVIVSGSTGSGKTTAMYAAVMARLALYAGHARSIENPVELRLKDWNVGNGLFIQTDISKRLARDEAWEHALAEAMRAFPAISTGKILMLGEMRHPIVAAEALTAADSGHLVFVSSHGTTLINAIRRFASYAAKQLGQDLARQMMGGTLRAVFHQRLRWLPHRSGVDRARVEGKVLLFREASDDEKPGDAANIVADANKDLTSLNQMVVQQQRILDQAAADHRYISLKSPDRRAKWREVGGAGANALDLFGARKPMT